MFWFLMFVVIAVYSFKQNKKMNLLTQEMYELYRTGRIDEEEFVRVLGYIPSVSLRQQREAFMGVKQQASPPPNVPTGAAVGGNVYAASAVADDVVHNNDVTAQPLPHNVSFEQSAAYDKKQVSSSSVMLTVGVILVSIAGLIFATAVWSTMSGLGRTATIAFAAAFFFIISTFSAKKLKVENSSSAFFMLGSVFTVTTFVTAGYYELMGADFSFEGIDRWAFLGTALLVMAVLALVGYNIYARRYFCYIAMSGMFGFYTLIAVNFSDKVSEFSLFMSFMLCGLAAYMTAKKTIYFFDEFVKLLTGLAVVMSLASPVALDFGNWKTADAAASVILLILISLCAYFNRSKLLWGLHSLYAMIMAANITVQCIDDRKQMLFALFWIMLALSLVYRALPLIRTKVSDIGFLAALVIAFLMTTDYGNMSLMSAVSALAVGGYISTFAFDKSKAMARNSWALILPLPLLAAAICVREYIIYSYTYSDVNTVVMSVLTVIYSLLTLLFVYLYKQNAFYKAHMNAFTVAACLLPVVLGAGYPSAVMLILFAALSAALASASAFAGNLQPMSVIPACVSAMLCMTAVSDLLDTDRFFADLFGCITVFVFTTAVSRIVFARSLHTNTDGRKCIDTFAFTSAFMLMTMFFGSTNSPSITNTRIGLFSFRLGAAVLSYLCVRPAHSERTNTAFRLISAFAITAAAMERPFLIPDTSTSRLKITVTLIAIFGFGAKYILRKNEKTAENFAMAVHIYALILLISDALSNRSLINTLIVMSTALTIMVISFIIKKKRWFLISAVMLVGLTIYICRDFLMSISWWVYLLAVGSLLIGIAVSNEYLKNKADGAEQKRGRFFEEWKW